MLTCLLFGGDDVVRPKAELLVKDREKPGSQNGFKPVTSKPMVLNLNEGSSTPYSGINVTDPQLKCTNLTVRAGDRIYVPRGMLHRAITSAGGSAHLSVALPLAPGLTWADLVAEGLSSRGDSGGKAVDASDAGESQVDHLSSGAGTSAFWTAGQPGAARARTKVLPGQCADGTVCKSDLVGKLLFALRHNADTSGPFALVPESVLLAGS